MLPAHKLRNVLDRWKALPLFALKCCPVPESGVSGQGQAEEVCQLCLDIGGCSSFRIGLQPRQPLGVSIICKHAPMSPQESCISLNF